VTKASILLARSMANT
jgi:hypothetical protein